jgi:hypothetical protein
MSMPVQQVFLRFPLVMFQKLNLLNDLQCQRTQRPAREKTIFLSVSELACSFHNEPERGVQTILAAQYLLMIKLKNGRTSP